MPYSFDGAILPYVQSAIIPLTSNTATAETPAHVGGYTGIRRAGARTATIVGTLKSIDFATLKSDWAALQAAHDVDGPRQLITRDGWFYYATPESLTESDVESSNLHYQADYRLGDPYSYSTTLSSASLPTSGSTTVTVGGSTHALPTVTINISTGVAGGTVTILNANTGETTTLLAETMMQIQFDSRIEKVVIGQPRLLTGQFLTLAKGANTITVTPSAGVVLSSASIAWRNRSF